jgi:hypothetical protein
MSAAHDPPTPVLATDRPRSLWSIRTLVPLVLAIGTLAGVTIPRMATGVCYADWGDLQMASATLGIGHEPGFLTFVMLLHPLTRLPGVDPAFMVTAQCLAAGIAAIGTCILVQVRLGVPATIAAAVGVVLGVHPWVWLNLVQPEVYTTSWLLVMSATYLLLRYGEAGGAWRPRLAAFLLGVVIASRPMVLFIVPGFVIAAVVADRRRAFTPAVTARGVILCAGVAMLPLVGAAGYLILRDTPGTPYNYMESYARETAGLPPIDGGAVHKLRRSLWYVTAADHHEDIDLDGRRMRTKIRWISRWISPGVWIGHGETGSLHVQTGLLLILAVLGAASTLRKSPELVWCMAMTTLGSAGFVLLYRQSSIAADLLPILGCLAAFLGVALGRLLRHLPQLGCAAVGWLLLIGVCVWTGLRIPADKVRVAGMDALPFVEAARLPELPENAVVFASWTTYPPLAYARLFLTHREDIDVVMGHPDGFAERIRKRRESGDDSPMYAADWVAPPPGWRLEPHGALSRIVLPGDADVP